MIAEHTILISGLNIRYCIAGDSQKQPLVFLHGWGARVKDILGRGQRNVISELSKDFYVIAPDLPGLVCSEPPREIWGMEEYAQCINIFLRTLGIKKPIVMGQSFGGGVATTYAYLYPEKIPELILADAVQGNRPENWHYRLRFKWQSLCDVVVGNRYLPLFLKRCLLSAWLGVPWRSITKENCSRYMIMGNIQLTYKVGVDYRKLSMPVLMIWGEYDTFVTPVSRAREIHAEIPNSKFVIIKKAGHLALYTHTRQVVSEIVDFWSVYAQRGHYATLHT